jgi:hypothetical protein
MMDEGPQDIRIALSLFLGFEQLCIEAAAPPHAIIGGDDGGKGRKEACKQKRSSDFVFA